MPTREYYTPAQATEITGASRPALRIYTNNYARWFSTEATPGAGASRKFTADDLKLIAFIRQQTALGQTHDQVQTQLSAGALDSFDWRAPSEDIAQESEQTALAVPYERLQAAQALLQDARQREDTTRQENAQLRARIEQLQLELGQAQGELSAYRRRRPRWWVAIFGE